MAADPIIGRVTISLRNRMDQLPVLQQTLARQLEQYALETEPRYALELGIEELVSNVMRHGSSDDRLFQIMVTVEIRADRIDLSIEDEGAPFDPNSWKQPETPTSIEDAPTGGMGISLVRDLSGPIQYTRVGKRNRVIVRIPRKKRPYS